MLTMKNVSVQIQTPSGNKVLGTVWSTHMDLLIYVSEKMSTEGLCGSFDGNQTNDIVIRGTGTFPGYDSGDVVDATVPMSWR